jgi:hypothetical protein
MQSIPKQTNKKRKEVTTGLAFQYWNCTHIFITTNGPSVIIHWLPSTQMRMDEMSMTQSYMLYSMYLKRKIERSFHMLTRRIGLWALCLADGITINKRYRLLKMYCLHDLFNITFH